MASSTIKPTYSANDLAWLAAYVAKNGPVKLNVGGHDATVQANGWIVVEDRQVTVSTLLLVAMTESEQSLVNDSAPSWVASWRASGAAE